MHAPVARIAVIEHDPDNRALLVAMLEPRYDVVACGRSTAVLPVVPDHQPHVVLWNVGDDDVQAPAVLERLRRDPKLAHAAIVAVTARVHRDAERYWLWLGFDGFVAKPILDKRALWDLIDELCGVPHGSPSVIDLA
jgi:putative two-component system response regulator